MKKNDYTHLLCRCAGMLLLMLYAPWVLAQDNVTVTGKVTSQENNAGLPGVNVVVKGTTTGTTTTADGEYTISAPANSTLVFSFIGYVNEEVAVGNRTAINVVLVPDIEALSEVVVIGYGEKSRKLLTESIGTVGTKEINQLPIASADQAIQGRVSGVQVTSVDGTPGSPVAIRIRGVGTVGNTQPLFVIDGVPVGNVDAVNTNPLATINPSDIETISVLKDASAAAVYGVRAANGVVLITTKRGKTGKPRINFDAYYGIQNFPKLFDWNSTQQYIALTQDAFDRRNAQDNRRPTDKEYLQLNPDFSNPDITGRNVDWQEAMLNKNAPIQNYNLGVSGGTENANYYISAGYFNQDATIRKWDLERYNFRANSDYKIGKRMRIGQTLTLSYQNVERGTNAGGDGFIFGGTANMPPFFLIYEDPNNPIPGNRYGFNGNANLGGLGTVANQFGINEIVKNRDQVLRLLGGVYGELDILPGLTYRSAASIDFSYNRNTSWQPGYTTAELGLPRDQNNFNDGRGENYIQVFTNTLNYQKQLGNHSFNALAGVEFQKLRGNGLSYGGSNFRSDLPQFYQSVKNQQGTKDSEGNTVFANAGSSISNNAFLGYVGRLSYDYKQKYLLTFTVRRDETASFAPENRVGTFPSVSAAWRISEEPFFASISNVVSDLKLRGSWGQLGNANTLPFPHIFKVSFTPDYGLGSSTVQAPSQTNLPNPNVIWETVETTDFGFDVSLFNDKVNLLATYYRRNTKDFLFELPLPSTAGFANLNGPNSGINLPVNAGNVLNTGVELELGYNTNIGQDLKLNLTGNLTTVKNRLTALAPNIQQFSAGDYRTAVGYPIGYFYGFKTAGIYQTDDEAANALVDKSTGVAPRAGDIIFEDNNGPATDEERATGQQFSGSPDGLIDNNDRTYLGKTIPDFFYGLGVNANYKGLDLAVLFQGVSGVQVYNQFRRNNENLGGLGRNQFTSTQNRWTGPGTSNTMPRAIQGDPSGNNRMSDRWVEDAGYFRLRNIQLGYSLPKTLLGKTKAFSNLRVYVSGSNLFVITQYSGLDPEVMTYGSNSNQLGAGTDGANIPQPRTYQVGLQVEF